MNLRRALLGVTFGGMVTLVAASAAWACLIPATMPTLLGDPVRAYPATQVHVTGEDYKPGVPITLHWDSAQGQELKSGISIDRSGHLDAMVMVPVNAAPGANHAIVATGDDNVPAMGFEVLAPGRQTTTTGTPPYLSTANASAIGLGLSTPAVDQPAQVPAEVPVQAANRGATNTGGQSGGSGPGSATSASPAGPGGSGAQLLDGNSGGGPSAAAPDRDADASSAPSARAFARDVWSGFTSGSSAGPPSLVGAPTPGSHTPGLAIGIVLALGASLALASGFGLAEARRRKALA